MHPGLKESPNAMLADAPSRFPLASIYKSKEEASPSTDSDRAFAPLFLPGLRLIIGNPASASGRFQAFQPVTQEAGDTPFYTDEDSCLPTLYDKLFS